MSGIVDRDVFCPRCRYNLRGLTEPRCPECALTFRVEELRSGILRENIPTWLDRCDPWQPHQVLVRSLVELVRGAARPRRLLHTLDANGPLAPAVLMLAVGTFWIWLLTTLLTAAATVLHEGASPAASLRCGALLWAPRLLAAGAAPVLASALLVRIPTVARIADGASRQGLRLAAYWIPTAWAWCCLPIALGLLVVPDVATGMLWAGPLFGGMLALYLSRGAFSARDSAAQPIVILAFVLTATGGGAWLSSVLLPKTLEPPMWIYFL